MISNQAKKRQPNDLVLATFRIPYEKWEKFQQAATAAGTTASATLLAFIEGYLAEGQTRTDAEITQKSESKLESNVETKAKTASEVKPPEVSQLNSQLKAEIEQQIAEIEDLETKELESQVSRINQRLDRVERKIDQLSQNKTGKSAEFIDVQAVPIDGHVSSDRVASDEHLSEQYDPENLGGLSQTGLCTEFGINPNNLNRHANRRGLSTAEYLHQLTGWIYRNGKYYPPES